MSGIAATSVETWRLVGASGLIGVRLFWKFTSVSKELLKMREDTSVKGIGGILSAESLVHVSERRALRSLLCDVIDRDDGLVLEKLQAVESIDIERHFPGLLGIAAKKKAERCITALTLRASVPSLCNSVSGLSAVDVGGLKKETLVQLLEKKVLHPDSWFVCEVGEEVGNRVGHRGTAGRERPQIRHWKPLLNALLDAYNFDGVEAVLEARGRMDVCEWEAEAGSRWEVYYRWERTPLHCLIFALTNLEKSLLENPQSLEHRTQQAAHQASLPLQHMKQRGVALIPRMVVAASKAGCLEWTAVVPLRILDESKNRSVMTTVEASCLELACACMQPEVVRELLVAGVRISKVKWTIVRKTIDGCHEQHRWLAERRGCDDCTRYSHPRALKKAEDRCLETLEILAEAGAGLESQSVLDGHTPLSLACDFGLQDVCQFLLNREVSVRTTGVGLKGETRAPKVPLVISLQHSHWVIAKLLLEAGADPNEIAWVDGKPVSPLVQAMKCVPDRTDRKWDPFCEWEEAESAVKLLIEKGAQCEIPLGETAQVDSAGCPDPASNLDTGFPLVFACGELYGDLARLLLEKAGADPGKESSIRNSEQTPVEALLRSGARSYLAPPEEERCVEQILESLTRAGADWEAEVDRDGHTPLSLACLMRFRKAVEFFLQHKAALTSRRESGGLRGRAIVSDRPVPLIICFQQADWPLATLLLEGGEDPNGLGVVDGTRVSPLIAAMQTLSNWGSKRTCAESTIKLLIEKGARCQFSGRAGVEDVQDDSIPLSLVSPLIVACSLGLPDLVRLFIEKGGADPNEKGKLFDDKEFRGHVSSRSPLRSPVETAVRSCGQDEEEESCCVEILKILADAGGDLECRSEAAEQTPLSLRLARESNLRRVVHFLTIDDMMQ
uniref:Uncharacterized protein n=1 Tax=Chromera velia CCMP2878 TaxID=1169474 RepID=A0A0G4I460_9ALVE|eukprot:Cvel_10837.t1-p1 / transcript=Cvel_10837.t1 / gene=Cvel_10837 / organism=Chromera_velia_CCMP2878 / gene_product=Ankyrin repeat domain-containing protein 17, putative / transcript_product=Ankyrin repeat domain-containing protein 17, putative / location=Cvel_scaffold663:17650-20343(+) / protein_length=898 / sequence_SO=supercontig / SO=protein_coding / is_pseudo=false